MAQRRAGLPGTRYLNAGRSRSATPAAEPRSGRNMAAAGAKEASAQAGSAAAEEQEADDSRRRR